MRSRRNHKPVIQTTGKVFSNGLLDVVRDDFGALTLAFTDGRNVTVSPRIELDGQVFVPPVLADSVSGAIQFPTRPQTYGSAKQLVSDLHKLIRVHPGLPDESVTALGFSGLATWFSDCTAMAPCVSIVAPDASGRDLLFRLLDCVCRHPLHVIEPTRAEILSLPFSLRPTIIINQAKPTREIQRLLCGMTQPGGCVPRNGQLQVICCSTVICSAEPLTDSLLLDRALQITLMPHYAAVSKVKQVLDSEFAKAFQPKLLQYRLQNFTEVRASTFDAPGLSSSSRDLAVALGACVVGDNELQSRVVQLLEPQYQESRARHSMLITTIVIESGLVFCHDNKKQSAFVGDFADVANGILHDRGETTQIEPRAVGDILRSVGLFPQRLGSAGRGIVFLNETRRKIHRLARAYDVRSMQDNAVHCKFCTEV